MKNLSMQLLHFQKKIFIKITAITCDYSRLIMWLLSRNSLKINHSRNAKSLSARKLSSSIQTKTLSNLVFEHISSLTDFL